MHSSRWRRGLLVVVIRVRAMRSSPSTQRRERHAAGASARTDYLNSWDGRPDGTSHLSASTDRRCRGVPWIEAAFPVNTPAPKWCFRPRQHYSTGCGDGRRPVFLGDGSHADVVEMLATANDAHVRKTLPLNGRSPMLRARPHRHLPPQVIWSCRIRGPTRQRRSPNARSAHRVCNLVTGGGRNCRMPV